MNVEPHDSIEELRTRYRAERNARLARRIQGVWLARRGVSCPQIVQVTGVSRRTVQQWMAKYNRGGIDELTDKPRSGRPALLSVEQQKQLAARVEAGPTEQDVVSVFSASAIDELVAREFGVVYSLRGMQRLLRRLGLSYQCPRPVHEKSDPQAQEAFKKTSRNGWRKSPPNIPASA